MEMECRFGMGSTNINGFVFIFGGSTNKKYTDATIHMVWKGAEAG